MAPTHPTVLVTGCSSGIGRATALLLAQSGFRVLAGVRCQQQADELANSEFPLLEPMIIDVTKEDHVERAVERIQQSSPHGLFALVNNAGVGLPAAVELSALDEVRQVLEVNTIAPLRMIQSCLPLLRAGRGRIVNMSSMNGSIAMPMVGVYSASKFALEALSDTLRVELRPWRISVSLIRPGQVRTSIFSKARESLSRRRLDIPEDLKSGYDIMHARAEDFNERGAKSTTSPEKVAQVVLRALEARRPKTHYLVGMDARGLQLINRLVPQRLFDSALARVIRALKPVG